jgi:hypothetical protein
VLVGPGDRVRQVVSYGPFVVQWREELEFGGRRLSRHRDATGTVFTVSHIEERAETGFCCQVVHLVDEYDGGRYVVDTGLMGPGLPTDAFEHLAADSTPETS